MDLCRIAVNIVRGTLSERIAAQHVREIWQDTVRYLVATDRSLAEDLREHLFAAVSNAVTPGSIEGKWHDTAEKGKGFRPGYVSFGVRPLLWDSKGINGTILIWGQYDPPIKTESPEPNTPEFKEFEQGGGNPDTDGLSQFMELHAGYYFKQPSGKLTRLEREEQETTENPEFSQDLGGAEFLLNKLEQVVELVLNKPAWVREGVDKIIEAVAKNPPEGAMTKNKAKKKQLSPYSSLRKFLVYLNDAGRNEYYKDEVDALYQWTGKPHPAIHDYLKRAYKTYVPQNRGAVKPNQLPGATTP